MYYTKCKLLVNDDKLKKYIFFLYRLNLINFKDAKTCIYLLL
jgi:hypothetical protein